MNTWFKNWRRGRGLDIEAQLKASRPTPSNHLVKSIAARVNPRPAPVVRTRTRIGVAGIATAMLVAAVGASGGFSSAANGISGAAKGAAQAAHVSSGPSLPGQPGPSQTQRGSAPSPAGAQYSAKPFISNFSPAFGAPGSTVTVSGTNFTGINQLTGATLNGHAANFVVTSPTTVSLTVPNTTSGPISVSNAAGSATTHTNFIVVTAPSITNVVTTLGGLTSGGVGTPLTINGNGFTGTTKVTFNNKPVAFAVSSNTVITTAVPQGAKTGVATVVVTTPVPPSASNATFNVISGAPTLTSFTPTVGKQGDAVTLKGSNFTGFGTLQAFFDDGHGNPVAAVVAGPTTATGTVITVPAGAGDGHITVLNNAGQATSSKIFNDISTPSVTGFTPSFGKAGTLVTITGSSFTGTTGVTFNGTAVLPKGLKVFGDTKITAVVPVGATTGLIHVTNNTGHTGDSATAFTVLNAAPDATGVSPGSGGFGKAITITGTNFLGATGVAINGHPASFSVTNGTTILATVPFGTPLTGTPKNAGIIVTNTVGSDATPVAFTVLAGAPTVTTFKPASGSAGDLVTLAGTNLDTVTAVHFGGGTAAPASQPAGGKSLTVHVPLGATTGKVTVDNPTGSATSKASFTVLATPVIVGFSPAYAKAGSTKVTIFGTNLVGATEVDFGQAAAKAKPTLMKNGSLVAIVPKNAISGPITVVVKTPDGTVLPADSGNEALTIVVKPNLTSDGTGGTHTVARGNTIDIHDDTGHSLVGITGVKVGTVNAQFHLNADNEIVVTIPAGAKLGKNQIISIGNAAGTGTWKVTITP